MGTLTPSRHEYEAQPVAAALWLAAWACALMQEFAGHEAGLFFKNPLKVSEIVESAGAAGSAATARSFL
jgi:hypothetical protein